MMSPGFRLQNLAETQSHVMILGMTKTAREYSEVVEGFPMVWGRLRCGKSVQY